MKKFNLKKQASKDVYTIADKTLDENRKNMNLSNDQQGVVGKNINLSLSVKNKDNTIPFNKQLDAERKNETKVSITESQMNDKIVNFGDKTEGVMPINVKTEEFVQKHADAFKKAQEASKKDTIFWDKYVGVQLEGEGQPTKVKNNIPASSSQLQNSPERFKGEEVRKMVMASIKDADAMLFHIHATAAIAGRKLTKDEEQQIIDINSSKARLLAKNMVSPVRRSLENRSKNSDPIIKEKLGKAEVYEADGTKIDEFKSCAEAKANYPEGEVTSA